MQLTLDFRSGAPIYVQVVDQIKHLVATGALKPDDQLPTVRQLATELRVNFNTIARAYNTFQAWEDPCGATPCLPTSTGGRGGNLVGETRIEIGVAYKDGVFSPSASTIGYEGRCAIFTHIRRWISAICWISSITYGMRTSAW